MGLCGAHISNSTLVSSARKGKDKDTHHPIKYQVSQQDQEKETCKFESDCVGPYIITIVYGSGAYQLATPEGELLEDPINSIHLRRFYA